MPKVKICGMQCAEDIDMAVRCGADAVGFITEVPVQTPRKIDAAAASRLIDRVPPFVDSVLVIMPDSASQALELIGQVRPDAIQIHNDLGAEDIGIIRDGLKGSRQRVIKTLPVPADSAGDTRNLLTQVEELSDAGSVDAILLDSARAGMSGGTGLTHDWSVSREIVENTDIPVILAGGLKPENVRHAVDEVLPFAVDTASGVETDGKKDPAKVCRFIKEARCTNA
ncbi:phosphoribosylanthranilate isomerase [Methanolobus chelungpuianus]|uniref:N-(5'-phosphoribosyl)anthranilate isomerase n=1 Tax=Methanolobus chelungpuianus TaxID=502115 RepID=A0AAE3KWZ6_9EURY|nr:N-(5'-phosphoribosyl)anthranilate isomerase [Methanolobus chelungpuianus]